VTRNRTSEFRKLSMYGFDLVNGGHNIHALLEFDITSLRSMLRKQRQAGQGGSLLVFLLKAIGLCLKKYPDLNSMINHRHTTSFDEVDINIPIEIQRDGKFITKQYIIRDIATKSVKQIADEIETARTAVDDATGFVLPGIGRAMMLLLPKPLVLLALKMVLRNHRLVKDLSGTAFVTSVSMFSSAPGFIIPYIGGPKACSIAIGSSNRKPVVVGKDIQIREMLNMTLVFNHDIVDGAPAARFINELRSLVESHSEEVFR
jgi:pyruvate/2-oxoglutarate dehydrogenase complex dihydrolipoamide acyltransferase (E2) component